MGCAKQQFRPTYGAAHAIFTRLMLCPRVSAAPVGAVAKPLSGRRPFNFRIATPVVTRQPNPAAPPSPEVPRECLGSVGRPPCAGCFQCSSVCMRAVRISGKRSPSNAFLSQATDIRDLERRIRDVEPPPAVHCRVTAPTAPSALTEPRSGRTRRPKDEWSLTVLLNTNS